MTLKAVYPGTFDPITLGHQDLVRRAANMFDEVILAVADSRAKKPFFTLDERVEMAKSVVGEYKNVTVMGFSGLLGEERQAGQQERRREVVCAHGLRRFWRAAPFRRKGQRALQARGHR